MNCAPIRSLLECGGKGVKGARHRFVIREPISLDRKRHRRSPLLPPNSAAALHKTEPVAADETSAPHLYERAFSP